jgi:hypothetical protein
MKLKTDFIAKEDIKKYCLISIVSGNFVRRSKPSDVSIIGVVGKNYKKGERIKTIYNTVGMKFDYTLRNEYERYKKKKN